MTRAPRVRRRGPRGRRLAALLPTLVLAGSAAVLATPVSPATADPTAGVTGHAAGPTIGRTIGPTPAPTGGSARAVAARALDRVERVFAGRTAGEATLALRDLALAAEHLPPAQRQRARALLARPTDPGPDAYLNPHYGRHDSASTCGTGVCVHWVETGRHRVGDDRDLDTVPDWVERNLVELERVHATYLAAGYRPVRGDRGHGGDDRLDVYLANVGEDGLYGYCTSDQPVRGGGPFAVWAYCVLDNDFSAEEFPGNTPLENMQVTAAHEYFHAVQFAHDVTEDAWLMEATATWAEDELYDDVDDNVQYLQHGPLRRPRVPLDRFAGLQPYAVWIWFRHLTERLPEERGGMPTLVRDLWAAAATRRDDPGGDYSLQALRRVLADRGVDLGTAFAEFADANRHPDDSYEESAAQDYPTAPDGRFEEQRRGWRSTTLSHLASASVDLRPTLTSTRLRVRVDLPARRRAPRAVLSVHPVVGAVQTRLLRLDRAGRGGATVAFDAVGVGRVDLTLVNASTRVRCDRPGAYSCSGTPRDDRLPFRYRVRVLD